MNNDKSLQDVVNIISENKMFYNNYMPYEMIQLGMEFVKQNEYENIKKINEDTKKILEILADASPYVKVWWYSILIYINKNEELLLQFVKDIEDNQGYFSINTRYYLYCQIKYIIIINEEIYSQNVINEIKKLFMDIVKAFAEKITVSLEQISAKDRDFDRVIVIVDQFLDDNNMIKQAALGICKYLVEIEKKKLLLINTTEVLNDVGKIPFYNAYYSKCDIEKKEELSQNYDGVDIPYFQCEYPMPDIKQIEILLEKIREMSPAYIISLCEDSLFSSLVNMVIPVTNKKIKISEIICNNKNSRFLFDTQNYDRLDQEKEEVINKFMDNFYKLKGNRFCDYGECSLEFYPYNSRGEYCVYNKKTQKFEDVFSIFKLENILPLPELKENCFSSITLQFEGNWMEHLEILREAKERKIYVICSDIQRLVSYYKIPELEEYMNNIKIFKDRLEYEQYFHENTSVYLPRIVFAKNRRDEYKIKKFIKNEHNYRLTDEGRDNSNVLLTIGIPTHNRGNLLLKRLENLFKMQYDAEIEIVVSKNGVDLYQNEYKEASQIRDSRYIYYGVDDELKPHHNWYNITKYMHGKYILFVSDEDDVEIHALEYYLHFLNTHPQLGVVRAKTSNTYASLEKEYGKKGGEAFYKAFLVQNYLSGLIFNSGDLRKADVMKFEKYSDNKFYQDYPHEWWCAAVSLFGDYYAETVELIEEKENVLNEEYEKLGTLKKNENFDEESGIPKYATYESRFKQFEGQIDFLNIFMKDNVLVIYLCMAKAIDKLAYLLKVARTYGYKKKVYQEFIDYFVMLTSKNVDYFLNDKEQKSTMKKFINEHYNLLIQNKEEYEKLEKNKVI